MAATVAKLVLPYSRFAAEYDATLGLPFFEQTRRAFERLVNCYGITFGSAADIGCGTGLFARHLRISRHVPVFAVDLSEPMLRIAARNCCGTNVVLLKQDIRHFRLPRRVDLITANFDTLNHILSPSDLRQTLRRVFENLNPGGHFVFDVITNCFALSRRSYVTRFRRQYRFVSQRVRVDPFKRLISIVVSIRSPNMRKPIIERHCERMYSLAEVGRALHETGFIVRAVHDAAPSAAATHCPQRIIVVASKGTEK
jgi:SAM-dependent methyltransferase